MATEAIIFQQIVDINWDQAIYTAIPNNSINVVQFAAKGSGANIGIALTPKGTGYLSAHVPNSAASGGSARGTYAVDWQTSRTSATQVASGAQSVLLGGDQNTASGDRSVVGGSACTGSGTNSVAIGLSNSATFTAAVAIGRSNSSAAAHALSTGIFGTAYVAGMRAHGNGVALGQAQEICQISVATTTTNSEVECLTVSSTRWVLRAGSVWSGTLYITGNKSDGTAFAAYERQVRIRRVVNTTSLVGTVNTIGTDEAAGTSISVTADDTNEALRVGVTGVSGETWTWTAVFHGLEKNI